MTSRDQRRERVAAKTKEYIEGAPVFTNTDLTYVVKPKERHLIHILMYTGPRFNPTTGEDTAEYRTQIFNVNEFSNFENNAIRLGYRYCFLHTPKNFRSKFEK